MFGFFLYVAYHMCLLCMYVCCFPPVCYMFMQPVKYELRLCFHRQCSEAALVE